MYCFVTAETIFGCSCQGRASPVAGRTSPIGLYGGARLGFGLVGIGAQRSDRTDGTSRILGKADPPAVVLQKMTKSYSLFFRHHRGKIEFDLVGVGIFRESESLREAHHVRVHADGLLAEGVAEQDIGGFSPDAGKG